MSNAPASPHRPAPRRSYCRFLLACAAMAIALALSPVATEAQQCVLFADCTCTPKADSTFIQAPDELGSATPQAECDYLKQLVGYVADDEDVRAVGYLHVESHHNGCVRGRRSLGQKSLAKGWRAWGAPDNVSVSGKSGAHAVMAWTKKDADGKTNVMIDLYPHGIYRTSGLRLDVIAPLEFDHLTFCQIGSRGIAVPTQNGQLDGPACCGTPYPKTPGARCTYRPTLLPGRQCRGPR